MSAISIFLATFAGLSLAPVMTARPSAAAQMSLELACHRTRPTPGITLNTTIRNGMSEPASIVVAYVRGNDVEQSAPGWYFCSSDQAARKQRVFITGRRGIEVAEEPVVWIVVSWL